MMHNYFYDAVVFGKYQTKIVNKSIIEMFSLVSVDTAINKKSLINKIISVEVLRINTGCLNISFGLELQ